ncbi:hypothetical protein FE783_25685 [Paenibacillus mesophilus]|uniref:YlaH-like family protein n=1 Tax=Paenibacillus mesophilus TaxID=2582849 RepID=UPI00110F2A5F|nr:YlaH-like family protein [Paenibacillus mesophilus]TMV46700.1 hypothetical protein FE783_25685 [Paenibacillus mesophilus]
MQQWLENHPLITYILIFVFLVYVYNKVFRMRKLPLLKDIVIYLTMAVGAGILWLFQLDLQLPIVISLGVAVALMLTVRIRYWQLDREARKKGGNVQKSGNTADNELQSGKTDSTQA